MNDLFHLLDEHNRSFFNSIICSLINVVKFVFQILMSLSHCKDNQGKYLFFQIDIPEVLI